MTNDVPHGIVSDVVITASRAGSAFKARATVVLWDGVRLSGFRLMGGVGGAVSVVWTERQRDGE